MTASTRKKNAGKKKTAANKARAGSGNVRDRETPKDGKAPAEPKLFQGAQLYPGLDKPARRSPAGAKPAVSAGRPAAKPAVGAKTRRTGRKTSADTKRYFADEKRSAGAGESFGMKSSAAAKGKSGVKQPADVKQTPSPAKSGERKKAADKKKRPAKRKKKNKLALFTVVFCMVLTVGGVFLALVSVGKARENTDLGTAGDGESEEITAEITQATEEAEQDDLSGETQGAAQESRYGALLADTERMERERVYAAETASSDAVVMAFAGDILFDPSYAVMAKLQQRGGAITEAFSEDLLAEMRGADIFMVNNEFPYTGRGTPTEGKQFTFRAKPESASYLTDMGVDIVSLANNHACDYGEVSLLDSLDTLEAMGMPYVGAGRNLEEAVRPVSFIANDKKITILSATQIERNDNPDTKGAGESTPGTFRCWNPDRLLEEIRKNRTECDILIVYIHWGTESQAETDWAQQDQAAAISEAGADVIIGDHSHCLQPVGYVNDVPVIYSLGNFWFNSKAQDTCLVQVRIPAEGELSVRVLPARQADCRTKLLDGAEKSRVIQYINSISDSGMLDEDGYLQRR